MDGNDVAALEFARLFKRFGDTVAVDHIDLSVPAGSFFGLVGPNGAGKTTALSMAAGLLRPDGGTVRIFGHDVWADPVAAKALIGVLPDGLALPDRLAGREILRYLGLLRGLPRDVVELRTDELLTVLELDGAETTAVADYSTGMKKKITLATALLHSPRLLLLDEPFEAVDPGVGRHDPHDPAGLRSEGRLSDLLKPRDGPRGTPLRPSRGDGGRQGRGIRLVG
jgi:ABC-2 type transport system ATP-binding protein